MNWNTWDNKFSLTVPMTEEELHYAAPSIKRIILRKLKKDYGISIDLKKGESGIVRVIIKEMISDFGVYKAMVTVDRIQLFGFALWIVKANQEE